MDEYQRGIAAIKKSIDMVKKKFRGKIQAVILYGFFACNPNPGNKLPG